MPGKSEEFAKFDRILRDVGEEGLPPDQRHFIDGSGLNFLKELKKSVKNEGEPSDESSEPMDIEDSFKPEQDLMDNEPDMETGMGLPKTDDPEELFVRDLFQELDDRINWDNIRTMDEDVDDWEEDGFDGSDGRDYEDQDVYQKIPPPDFVPPPEKKYKSLSSDLDSLFADVEAMGLPGSHVEVPEEEDAGKIDIAKMKAELQEDMLAAGLTEDEFEDEEEEWDEEPFEEQAFEEPEEEPVDELEDIPEMDDEVIDQLPDEEPDEEEDDLDLLPEEEEPADELADSELQDTDITDELEEDFEEDTEPADLEGFMDDIVEPEDVSIPPKPLETEEPDMDLEEDLEEDFEELDEMEDTTPPIIDEEELTEELPSDEIEELPEEETFAPSDLEQETAADLPGTELTEDSLTDVQDTELPMEIELGDSELSPITDDLDISVEGEPEIEEQEIPKLEEEPEEEIAYDQELEEETADEESDLLEAEAELEPETEELAEEEIEGDETFADELSEPADELEIEDESELLEEGTLEEGELDETGLEEGALDEGELEEGELIEEEEPEFEEAALEDQEELAELEDTLEDTEETTEELSPDEEISEDFQEDEDSGDISDDELMALTGDGELPEEEYVEEPEIEEEEMPEAEEVSLQEEEEPHEEMAEEEPAEEPASEMMEEPEAEEGFEQPEPEAEEAEVEDESAIIEKNINLLSPDLSDRVRDVINNDKLDEEDTQTLVSLLLKDPVNPGDIKRLLDEKLGEQKKLDLSSIPKIAALFLIIAGLIVLIIFLVGRRNQALQDSFDKITQASVIHGAQRLAPGKENISKEVDNFLRINEHKPDFDMMMELAGYLSANYPDLAIKILLGHSFPEQDGEETFQGAMFHNPANKELHMLLGDSYRNLANQNIIDPLSPLHEQKQKYDESIRLFNQAVYHQTSPDISDASQRFRESGYGFHYQPNTSDIEVLFKMGDTYKDMGTYLDRYSRIQLYPSDRERYLAESQQAYDKARSYYTDIQRIDPGNIDVKYSMLSLNLLDNETLSVSQVWGAWSDINRSDPSGDYLQQEPATHVAEFLIKNGEYEKSKSVIEKILLVDQENDYTTIYPPSLYYSAINKLSDHSPDDAEEQLISFQRYALNQKPWYTDPDDLEDAMEDGLLITNPSPPEIKAEVNNMLGMISNYRSDYYAPIDSSLKLQYKEMAKNHFIKAIDDDPTFYSPYQNLGDMYYNDALRSSNQYLTDVNYISNELGRIVTDWDYAQANYEKAQSILKETQGQHYSVDPSLNYNLGYIYYNRALRLRERLENQYISNQSISEQDENQMKILFGKALENWTNIYVDHNEFYTQNPNLIEAIANANYVLGELESAKTHYNNLIRYHSSSLQVEISETEGDLTTCYHLLHAYNNRGVIKMMIALNQSSNTATREMLLDEANIDFYEAMRFLNIISDESNPVHFDVLIRPQLNYDQGLPPLEQMAADQGRYYLEPQTKYSYDIDNTIQISLEQGDEIKILFRKVESIFQKRH